MPTTRSRAAQRTAAGRAADAAAASDLDSESETTANGGLKVPSSSTKRDPSQDRVDRGRPRSGLEIPRKLLHSSIGILVTRLWLSHPSVPLILNAAAIALAFVTLADVLRFRFPAFEMQYENVLGYFMRESERHRVNGVIFYLVGVLICLTFYPRDIAALSIIILSLCDTSASVFGRLFGRYTWPLPFSGTLFGAKKSLAGTIAAVTTGALASYYFWSRLSFLGDEGDLSWVPGKLLSQWKGPVTPPPTIIPRLPIPKSTLGLVPLSIMNGVVAGVAEAFDVWGLDDNLTLPVLFGFGAWFSMWILG
ncbi:hypothetical protein T439DRAFT_378437 [Meredithblackwellia eburnea MCA 4105]